MMQTSIKTADTLLKEVKKYIVFEREVDYCVFLLWGLSTHLPVELFHQRPVLYLYGRAGSGKTTALRILNNIVKNGKIITGFSSSAALLRAADKGCFTTLLLDEIDFRVREVDLSWVEVINVLSQNDLCTLKADRENKKGYSINKLRGAVWLALSSTISSPHLLTLSSRLVKLEMVESYPSKIFDESEDGLILRELVGSLFKEEWDSQKIKPKLQEIRDLLRHENLPPRCADIAMPFFLIDAFLGGFWKEILIDYFHNLNREQMDVTDDEEAVAMAVLELASDINKKNISFKEIAEKVRDSHFRRFDSRDVGNILRRMGVNSYIVAIKGYKHLKINEITISKLKKYIKTEEVKDEELPHD